MAEQDFIKCKNCGCNINLESGEPWYEKGSKNDLKELKEIIERLQAENKKLKEGKPPENEPAPDKDKEPKPSDSDKSGYENI